MEALAAEWERRANTAEASAEATAHFTDEECAAFRGEQKTWHRAAHELREALAAEAAPVVATECGNCGHAAHLACECPHRDGSGYGCVCIEGPT